jgi:POT family proton-dependent oligopeptide transporter
MDSAAARPLEPASAPPAREDKMPSGIWFIVSNEFAERFCFYGINSILAIYLTSKLHFTDAKAASWQSLFKMGAYFFPMLGAIISDVFWGKFRTIMVFSMVYALGCAALAIFGSTESALIASLLLVAIGTGGIKPCVSTNVGDQFTSKNAHLIERAFSLFYLAINAGSSISIFLCPILLDKPGWGPRWAFGMPALMMVLATVVFIAGRRRYAHVPPAGKAWVDEILEPKNLKLALNLLLIYFFVAIFWMLWDQSNGNTWTLQAASSLMDKNLGFGITLLPAQLQVVNGLFILALVPIFTFGIYPAMGKLFKVTPLRKIGIGLFTAASSFLVVAWIEQRIQGGHVVSCWWQMLAYVVMTAAEILVSIRIAAVNRAMVKPLHAQSISTGAETWVTLTEAREFVTGQKIDIGGENGLTLVDDKGQPVLDDKGKPTKLAGTFLVAEIDAAQSRVRIMDAVKRGPVGSTGTYDAAKAEVSTYKLVGPMYFLFFIAVMCVAGVIFIFVAMAYKEQTHVRE